MASHTIIPIHACPKASANSIDGWTEDANGERWLKVRITSAPQDGKANQALLAFLSKQWHIPKSAITIVSGATSRYKRVAITEGYHVPTDYDD